MNWQSWKHFHRIIYVSSNPLYNCSRPIQFTFDSHSKNKYFGSLCIVYIGLQLKHFCRWLYAINAVFLSFFHTGCGAFRCLAATHGAARHRTAPQRTAIWCKPTFSQLAHWPSGRLDTHGLVISVVENNNTAVKLDVVCAWTHGLNLS